MIAGADVVLMHCGGSTMGAVPVALAGLLGNDQLDGGIGEDLLASGLVSDTFVFGKGFGRDTITDWQDNSLLGDDRISFQGLGLSLRDLLIADDRLGATVSIIGTDNAIYVEGARRGSLTAEDFLF
jgi:Ca2+-binding RTX toxin-like protein